MSCNIDLIKKTDEYIATADESHKLIARNEGCWALAAGCWVKLSLTLRDVRNELCLPLSVGEFRDCQDDYR